MSAHPWHGCKLDSRESQGGVEAAEEVITHFFCNATNVGISQRGAFYGACACLAARQRYTPGVSHRDAVLQRSLPTAH
jgi:hypothetical protein